VRLFLQGGAGVLCEEFTEIESGKRSCPPQLAGALEIFRLKGAMRVIVKLDRPEAAPPPTYLPGRAYSL
jgi:hypothetical protein